MQLAPRTESFIDEDRRWIGDSKKLQADRHVNVDPTLFATAFPDGLLKSGMVLAQQASGDKYWGPYAGGTNEVQTVTEGGAGLTSYTLTYAGQTTASIAAAATATAVRTALEALSNIAPGDVTVTGSASGPYTVTFGGALADTNVAQMTATPTGGTGTVTVATTTAGTADAGSGGLEVAVGVLYTTTRLRLDGGIASLPLYDNGALRTAFLPYASGPGSLDAAARTDLASHFRFYDV